MLILLNTDLFADGAVSILVHVLEDLLQRSLLAHELSEGQTTIKVPVHPLKEIRDLIPKQLFIGIFS